MIPLTRESRVKIPRRGNETTTAKNPHGVWVVNRLVNLDSFTVGRLRWFARYSNPADNRATTQFISDPDEHSDQGR